jgi:hypothetical protein
MRAWCRRGLTESGGGNPWLNKKTGLDDITFVSLLVRVAWESFILLRIIGVVVRGALSSS